MYIKLLFLYCLTRLQHVSCISSISVDNIVRFTCNRCKDPQTCCLGTLIQPNIVLTTSFCANFCQVTKNGQIVPIIKVYIFPHYRKYFVMKRIDVELTNIALALLESKIINQKYVKLSAVEPFSTIGLKVYIPVSNERNLRRQSTVIQRCENAYIQSSAYHVCTGRTVLDLKTCQQVQGVPLLLADRLLGMSILHDCRLMQKIFIAVGPHLFWISSTIKQIYEYQKRQHFVLKNAMLRIQGPSSTTESMKFTRSANSTMDVKEVEKTTEVVANETIIVTTLPAGNMTTLGDETNNKTTKPILKSPARTQDASSDLLTTSKEISPELNSTVVSESFTADSYIPPSNNSLANIMKWFKVQRNKVDEKPQAFLILTRSSYKKLTTKFVDLT